MPIPGCGGARPAGWRSCISTRGMARSIPYGCAKPASCSTTCAAWSRTSSCSRTGKARLSPASWRSEPASPSPGRCWPSSPMARPPGCWTPTVGWRATRAPSPTSTWNGSCSSRRTPSCARRATCSIGCAAAASRCQTAPKRCPCIFGRTRRTRSPSGGGRRWRRSAGWPSSGASRRGRASTCSSTPSCPTPSRIGTSRSPSWASLRPTRRTRSATPSRGDGRRCSRAYFSRPISTPTPRRPSCGTAGGSPSSRRWSTMPPASSPNACGEPSRSCRR